MPRPPCRVPATLALFAALACGSAGPAFAQPATDAPKEAPKEAPREAPKTDAKPAEPTRSEPAKSEPAKTEPAKTETAKDPFGEELTLVARNAVTAKGSANWDSAFETITKALKGAREALAGAGGKSSAPPLVIYTSTDDTGFSFEIALPVDDMPANLPKSLGKGLTPAGKALKFVHRGSYDNMDNTYEAITNHLDANGLEAQDSFIEEYVVDPLQTAEDKLVINVLVPLKDK